MPKPVSRVFFVFFMLILGTATRSKWSDPPA
jgi:hypothetical protein